MHYNVIFIQSGKQCVKTLKIHKNQKNNRKEKPFAVAFAPCQATGFIFLRHEDITQKKSKAGTGASDFGGTMQLKRL